MEIRLSRHCRHVTIVTIDNQPRLNAMTRQMLTELGCLWDELERDGNCRCIILTGAGQDRRFPVNRGGAARLGSARRRRDLDS
jgi:enoyl-CoA hydratase/carnithine racemase